MNNKSYRANVKAMCDRIGIASDPIPETGLNVESVSFLVGGEWQSIAGTDMNKAARLFFQDIVHRHDPAIVEITILWGRGQFNYNLAKNHFAELWKDAIKQGRSMLIAMRKAEQVRIHWKS